MSKTTTAVAVTGALGAAAGIGYALTRYLRNSPAAKSSAESDVEPSTTPSGTSTNEPAPHPSAAMQEPALVDGNKRINRSQHVDGKVVQSPDELLAQARQYAPSITLDELTGARLIASEHDSATATEASCIVDSEANRAKRRGRSLFDSLTRGHGFGKQGRERPASTRLDPTLRQLWLVRQVLFGPTRGISRGAVRFFDPVSMWRMNYRYRRWLENGRIGKKPAIVSCNGWTLLEAWSFDYGKQGKSRCPPDRTKTGPNTLAWVGPIAGVDATRLLLMKPMPLGAKHTEMYEAARKLLTPIAMK